MSKLIEDWDDEEPDVYDQEIADDDYGIIISASGELKCVFAPDGFIVEPPETVRKILKMLGIDDINAVLDQDTNSSSTLH